MIALWTLSDFYFPPRKQDDDHLTGLGWGINHHVYEGVKAGHLKGVQQTLSFPKPGGWYLQRPQKPSFPFIYTWSLNCEAAGWKIQVVFFFFFSYLWVWEYVWVLGFRDLWSLNRVRVTDRGAWQATVHRVTKSQTRLKQLSTCTTTSKYGNRSMESVPNTLPRSDPFAL